MGPQKKRIKLLNYLNLGESIYKEEPRASRQREHTNTRKQTEHRPHAPLRGVPRQIEIPKDFYHNHHHYHPPPPTTTHQPTTPHHTTPHHTTPHHTSPHRPPHLTAHLTSPPTSPHRPPHLTAHL